MTSKNRMNQIMDIIAQKQLICKIIQCHSILRNYWIGRLSSEMLRNAANILIGFPQNYNIT